MEHETLDSIMQNYNIILLDTCILEPLDIPKQPKSLRGDFVTEIKSKRYSDEIQFISLSIEKIKEGSNLYFTPLVLEEIEKSNQHSFHYRRIVKRHRRRIDELHLNLLREINRLKRTLKELVEISRENDKVITFNETEKRFYEYYSSEFNHTKERYKLSETDFNFLISGLALSYDRSPVALFSNDFSILYSWKNVLRRLELDPKLFGFYFRKHFPYLERAN